MADKGKSIIIKKIKKGHGGHHGGAWKVAYADFVTAMMAFFLLLWLLTMTDQQKRMALSQYFTDFSLFEKSGTTMLMEGQSGVMKDAGGGKVRALELGEKTGLGPAESLKEKLKKEIEAKLQALKDQTSIDIFEGGIRIQIFDVEGKSMFLPGSTQLSRSAKEIIKVVSENIRELPNKIAVEGHTDAAPLKKGQITNWELSTDRASSARRELELNGVKHEQIARVVGYADTEPLIKERPTDPQNRRISIILLQSKVAEMTQPTKASEAKPAPQLAPPPPPPAPVQQEPAVKKPFVPSQEQKKDVAGPDLGIRPKGPIEIKGPIKDVKPSPGGQAQPVQPKAGQQKQAPAERPAPPPPPPPPPKVEPQTKKQPVEKSTPKQDMGIKPIAPIVPGVQGKGQAQPVQPKAGQQKQAPAERPAPPPPPPPSPKVEPQTKKQPVEKSAPKQDMGIKPIAPIVPGVQGKGQAQPVQPKAGQQKQAPAERPAPPPPPPKSESKAKKSATEKPATKEEQKKDIGIEPIAPIVPGIGK